jgi:hypothetical protein
MMRKYAWAVVVAAVGISACGGEEALGERQVSVPLAYGTGSNWGPEDATGVAYLDTKTGTVEIEVAGLPPLENEVYEGWLAGGGETPISTGRFNTGADQTGNSTIELGDISSRSYERVVITVEPEPDPTPAPDPRHSIEGMIP